MVFRVYFKNPREAEKATLVERFNSCVIDYKEGDNFVLIDLSIDGMTAKELLTLFISTVYSQEQDMVSPREKEQVSKKLSEPIMYQIYNNNSKEFERIEI